MSNFPEDYETDPGFDPAEDHMGPFYWRKEGDDYRCAFLAEQKNCNVNGFVHGGVLMSFADFALCIGATDHYNGESVTTVSFSADFMAAAEIGSIVECVPRVVRRTGSLAFVSGDLVSEGTVVMTASSVMKRLREKS